MNKLGMHYFISLFIILFCTNIVFAKPVQQENIENQQGKDYKSRSDTPRHGFFDQQYRGWLWFDEEEKYKEEMEKPEAKPEQILPATIEQMEKAKKENEQFEKELELMRHMMVRYPDNIDYIVAYKKKEKEMQDRALLLGNNWSVANFLHPEIINELENPLNIYGRRSVKAKKEQKESQILAKLKDQVELFIFRQDGCMACSYLEKHLFNYATKHKFSVTAISADKTSSKFFKTYFNKDIIKQLKLELVPTVIAITKNGRHRFELARGAVSISELKDKSLILYQHMQKHGYLQNQENQVVKANKIKTEGRS